VKVMAAPAPATISCHIENPTFTVGEVRVLSCDVTGVTVTAQSKLEFSFTPTPVPTGSPGAGNENYQIQFLGTPSAQGSTISQNVTGYRVGTHSLNQIKLKIDEHEYLVSPQSFETRTIINQTVGSNPTPYPLVGPEGVAIPTWWWVTVGILAAVILGVALWQFIKFKKRREAVKVEASKPKLTPQELFHAKIRKLESKGLHNRGEYKLFALELTTIIKKTIGEELHFQAEDLTSEELLSTLERRHRVYSNTAGATLEAFLADLDQIKFAKIETDAQKCSDLIDRGARIGNALFGRIG
jgi:hypothetical protein